MSEESNGALNMKWSDRERGKARNVCILVIGTLTIWGSAVVAGWAQEAQLARGKYLVTFGACTDCHTPGHLLGKPDMNQFLGGSDVGFAIPGVGVFVGRNLTPDQGTGLGSWTRDQIATAITTGVRPDGRVLAPIMPWAAYAQLTKADVIAIASYLQSLPPVRREVPGPFGPNEKASVFVMDVLPADMHNNLLQHSAGSPSPAK
jgi:mono/diheme cytochrome c family protein